MNLPKNRFAFQLRESNVAKFNTVIWNSITNDSFSRHEFKAFKERRHLSAQYHHEPIERKTSLGNELCKQINEIKNKIKNKINLMKKT